MGGALAEDARYPAARGDRARSLQPAGAAGALEEGRGRARQARHQDRVAVGGRLEEVRRRRARGEPCAHEGAHGEGRRHGELRPRGEALHAGLAEYVKVVVKAYDAAIYGMAGVAAFLMAAMMVVICLDVL